MTFLRADMRQHEAFTLQLNAIAYIVSTAVAPTSYNLSRVLDFKKWRNNQLTKEQHRCSSKIDGSTVKISPPFADQDYLGR